MATKGTPLVGLNEILRLMWVVPASHTLVCYTNTANSLGDNTVFADLVQPTVANGYAPITLTNTSWTIANAAAVYTGSTQWSATGAWSGTVYGYAIIGSTGIIRHFKDLAVPFIATNGGKLAPNLLDLTAPT